MICLHYKYFVYIYLFTIFVCLHFHIATLDMSNPSHWTSHLENWPQNHNVGPICVHAEGDTTANIILMAKGRPLHICHVARKSELGI